MLSATHLTAVAKRILKENAHRVYRPLAYALANSLSSLIIDREQLQVICRQKGLLIYYGASEVFEIALPLLPPAGKARTAFERRVGSHSISQPFVGELPSVRLVGQYPMPIHDRQLVLEAVGRPDVALLNLVYTIAEGDRIKLTAQNRTIECAVVLHDRWSQGYFHWVAETLTRLEGVERYRKCTGRQPTLILGPNPPPFQTESLRLLGYDEDDWLE